MPYLPMPKFKDEKAPLKGTPKGPRRGGGAEAGMVGKLAQGVLGLAAHNPLKGPGEAEGRPQGAPLWGRG